MKKIIVFAGSNSSTSINKRLARYAATIVKGAQTEFIELEEYAPPMYSIDLEKEYGSHETVKKLYDKLQEADGWIISASEHNHAPQAFFKNILDWLTRTQFTFLKDKDYKFAEDMPVLLMSASPGKGAAAASREKVKYALGIGNANIVAEFGLPSFNHTFDNNSIIDEELDEELRDKIQLFMDEVLDT